MPEYGTKDEQSGEALIALYGRCSRCGEPREMRSETWLVDPIARPWLKETVRFMVCKRGHRGW